MGVSPKVVIVIILGEVIGLEGVTWIVDFDRKGELKSIKVRIKGVVYGRELQQKELREEEVELGGEWLREEKVLGGVRRVKKARIF